MRDFIKVNGNNQKELTVESNKSRYKSREAFLWNLWVECMDWQNANPDLIKDESYQAYKKRVANAYTTHTYLVNRDYNKFISAFLKSLNPLFKP